MASGMDTLSLESLAVCIDNRCPTVLPTWRPLFAWPSVERNQASSQPGKPQFGLDCLVVAMLPAESWN